ncbi:hypothetical protein NPIL_582241 [Nephila pilipes]|uniref:Uncharacterized protein n=1 Tax=Nephila pilipes TaxID=299642 RepID=A0A8X6N8I7_NEPPI|nr:hypothetical protein NPIL_582241 [Nephila pilipes]
MKVTTYTLSATALCAHSISNFREKPTLFCDSSGLVGSRQSLFPSNISRTSLVHPSASPGLPYVRLRSLSRSVSPLFYAGTFNAGMAPLVSLLASAKLISSSSPIYISAKSCSFVHFL